MTPSFIPMYGSSIVAIVVLALFARHNRKTGWKRQSGKFAQWLNGFYEGAYVDGSQSESAFRAPVAPPIPTLAPITYMEIAGFSEQLMKLRSSLGTAGQAPVFEAPRVVHGMMHK